MLKKIAFLSLLIAARPIQAQVPTMPPPSAPPESVVTTFLADLRAGDWKSGARLMDSSESAHFATVMRQLAAKPGVGAGLAQAWHITEAQLQSLSPPELLGAVMQVASENNAAVKEAFSSATFTILGRVDEAPDQAHIVVRSRMSVQGIPITATEVRSLRKSASGWRIELPSEMTGMMAGVEASMAGQQ